MTTQEHSKPHAILILVVDARERSHTVEIKPPCVIDGEILSIVDVARERGISLDWEGEITIPAACVDYVPGDDARPMFPLVDGARLSIDDDTDALTWSVLDHDDVCALVDVSRSTHGNG